MMRKNPQDYAFPLGLGSKRQNSSSDPGQSSVNNRSMVNNNIAAVAPSPDDVVHSRAQNPDLDTINL